jgi:peptidoglycan hydrolase CwlO-like protein
MPKNYLLKQEVEKLKAELVAKDERIAELESQLDSTHRAAANAHQETSKIETIIQPEPVPDAGVEVEVVLAQSCVDELSAKDREIRELTKKKEDLETKIKSTHNTPHQKRWWLF